MKTLLILMYCLVLISFSCSEEIKPTPYTYTTIFTGQNSKTWKLKFVEQTLDGSVVETFNLDCAADDKYILYANSEHSTEAYSGLNKCNTSPEEAAVITDSWTFNNASATLTLLLPFLTTENTLPFIVREAKKNKMELEIFLDQQNSESYRIHFESTDEN